MMFGVHKLVMPEPILNVSDCQGHNCSLGAGLPLHASFVCASCDPSLCYCLALLPFL